MEQLMQTFMSGEFGLNALIALFIAIATGLFGLWFFRNKIKAIVVSITGSGSYLDDLEISKHDNKDVIYENNKVALTVGATPLDALWLFGSFMSALVSPYLFVIGYAAYEARTIKRKMALTKNYKIFDFKNNNDTVVAWLNEKSAKVNIVVENLWVTSFVLLASGLFFGLFWVAATGTTIAFFILLSSLVMISNAGMYKQNGKSHDYYKALKLLKDSSLGGNYSLYLLSFLGFISNFTELAGFTPFLWLLFGVNMVTKMTMNNALQRETRLLARHQEVDTRERAIPEKLASYPNFSSQSTGKVFATPVEVKDIQLRMEEKYGKENLLTLSRYAVSPQMKNDSILSKNPELLKRITEGVETKINPLAMSMQVLAYGSVGSGKSQWIYNIAQQVIESDFTLFKAIAYNDMKGDFVQRFYREDHDHILSLFDERASAWCIFTEMKYNKQVAQNFIENLFNSLVGSGDDFWIARAKQLLTEWVEISFEKTSSNIEAWEMIFSLYKAYDVAQEETDNKTKASLLETINLGMGIFEDMRELVVTRKCKIFLINEFINTPNTQMFLVNSEAKAKKLEPYLTGLWGAYVAAMLGKDDREDGGEDHLILNILDEFANIKMGEKTRKALLTTVRSKGGCNLVATQYVPESDKKLREEMNSSYFSLHVFNTDSETTKDFASGVIGDAEALTINATPREEDTGTAYQVNGQSPVAALGILKNLKPVEKGSRLSYAQSNVRLMPPGEFQSLLPYHHFVYFPKTEVRSFDDEQSEKLFRLLALGYEDEMRKYAEENPYLHNRMGAMYLAYTPQATLNYGNKAFIPFDDIEAEVISPEQDKTDTLDEDDKNLNEIEKGLDEILESLFPGAEAEEETEVVDESPEDTEVSEDVWTDTLDEESEDEATKVVE